jgi:predicted RNA-binding Zn-ribbon protein involved in translation (DUF1610 family)
MIGFLICGFEFIDRCKEARTVAEGLKRTKLTLMNEDSVQCPSCGEWFVIAAIGPEDFGSELDYDCEVC